MLINNFLIMPQLNNRHLVEKFNALVRPPTDWVSFEVEVVLGFVGNLNPLTGHMIVAEPLSSVIAKVDVVSEDVKAMT